MAQEVGLDLVELAESRTAFPFRGTLLRDRWACARSSALLTSSSIAWTRIGRWYACNASGPPRAIRKVCARNAQRQKSPYLQPDPVAGKAAEESRHKNVREAERPADSWVLFAAPDRAKRDGTPALSQQLSVAVRRPSPRGSCGDASR